MYRYRRSTEGHSSFIEPFPTYEVYLVNLGIFPRPWTAEKLSQLAISLDRWHVVFSKVPTV